MAGILRRQVASSAAKPGIRGVPDINLGPCPICGRQMVEGASVDRHHWVPRTQGGRDSAPLHRICHRMLHRLFSQRELATVYNAPDALADHPDIRAFVAWVQRKPADFVDWPRAPAGRDRRRPAVRSAGRR